MPAHCLKTNPPSKYRQQQITMYTNTRITHASNKDTHPGMPDIDEDVLGRPILKPRRTKAQITEDNAATAEKKSAKAEVVLGKFGLVRFEALFAKPETKLFGFFQIF